MPLPDFKKRYNQRLINFIIKLTKNIVTTKISATVIISVI